MRSQLKNNLAISARAAFLFLTAGCMPAVEKLEKLEIADLQRMPQTPLAYVDEAGADQPLPWNDLQSRTSTVFPLGTR